MPSKNKKKKNKKANKAMRRALEQTPPTNKEFATHRDVRRQEGETTIQDMKNHWIFTKNIPPEEVDRKLELYETYSKEVLPLHEPKWDKIEERMVQASENKQWAEVEALATEILANIKKVETEYWKNIYPTKIMNGSRMAFYEFESTALGERGWARTQLGKYEEAIVDLTEAVNYGELWKVQRPDFIRKRVIILSARAKCYEATGEPEKTIVDLEACCAVIRSDDWVDDPKELLVSQDQLLRVMARRKVGSPRPHYNKEERKSLERKFAVGRCADAIFSCHACGKDQTLDNDIKLRLCGRCEQVWYCSKECQTSSWLQHREECSTESKIPIVIADKYKTAIMASFDSMGVGSIQSGKGVPDAIVRDSTTGRMFGSLSDNDVYFVPSEAGFIPKKDLKLYESIGERLAARNDGCRVERTEYTGYDECRAFAQIDEESLRQLSKERVRKQLANGNDASEGYRRTMEYLDFACMKKAQQRIAEELSEGDK